MCCLNIDYRPLHYNVHKELYSDIYYEILTSEVRGPHGKLFPLLESYFDSYLSLLIMLICLQNLINTPYLFTIWQMSVIANTFFPNHVDWY